MLIVAEYSEVPRCSVEHVHAGVGHGFVEPATDSAIGRYGVAVPAPAVDLAEPASRDDFAVELVNLTKLNEEVSVPSRRVAEIVG